MACGRPARDGRLTCGRATCVWELCLSEEMAAPDAVSAVLPLPFPSVDTAPDLVVDADGRIAAGEPDHDD